MSIIEQEHHCQIIMKSHFEILISLFQVLFLFVPVALGGDFNDDLHGPDVCLKTVSEVVPLNVSYNVVETIQVSYFCVTSLSLRCSSAKDVLKTKYKVENVTRKKSHRVCCEGYEETPQKTCLPSCKGNPCLKGACTDPGVCTCDIGYSGIDCSDIGCPDPYTWGQGCSEVCVCEKDTSICDPKDGSCLCYPGYGGKLCDQLCPPNTYGQNCSGTCHCTPGSRCHHVTGNCVPCDPGYYGNHCGSTCTCSAEGTLLCHPGTGYCVCKPGFYGITCEDHCPFGMKDGECYKEPIPDIICACRDEIAMACDPVKGCVCQFEGACEDYSLPAFAINSHSRAKTPASEVVQSASSSTSIVVSVVLILICIIVLCGALYYRRRFIRAQKDLRNRAVIFARPENSVSNQYECVITQKNDITLNNLRGKKNENAPSPVEPIPGPSSGPSNNVYEEIGSPSGIKNNEQLAAFYKKNLKQASVNDVLNDPLYWQPQESNETPKDKNSNAEKDNLKKK